MGRRRRGSFCWQKFVGNKDMAVQHVTKTQRGRAGRRAVGQTGSLFGILLARSSMHSLRSPPLISPPPPQIMAAFLSFSRHPRGENFHLLLFFPVAKDEPSTLTCQNGYHLNNYTLHNLILVFIFINFREFTQLFYFEKHYLYFQK